MARITALLSTALLATTASAHFSITIPGNQLGGRDQGNQNTGPCGGHTVEDGAETVDFHVGGQQVAVMDLHSRSDWLIRGTLDTGASSGWEELYPIYQTRGEGRSCQPSVRAPEEWVGKTGVLSVVGQAEDGNLFACSYVSFVEGTADANSECRNGSSIVIDYVENADLTALLSNTTDSGSESESESASPSASSTGGSGGSPNGGSAASSLTGGAMASIAITFAAAVGGAVLMM
ncbi:hypothetical protein F5X68DRAFT_45058 [Plectosphaerella plurivora]|uniref:Copper acquisition factor BIM1-like domain-containing protein n=1 Tax=Plectosphaerella plurivora TaxID=936078 RepID=A0A9P8VH84_9PEZI|nr:hypothetical protein F5X68DRAFT_45058 [Plectosphaerella plurivora]